MIRKRGHNSKFERYWETEGRNKKVGRICQLEVLYGLKRYICKGLNKLSPAPGLTICRCQCRIKGATQCKHPFFTRDMRSRSWEKGHRPPEQADSCARRRGCQPRRARADRRSYRKGKMKRMRIQVWSWRPSFVSVVMVVWPSLCLIVTVGALICAFGGGS